MQPDEPEITDYKQVKDNSVILSAVETLLSSAGYDTNQLNVALDVLKNAMSHHSPSAYKSAQTRASNTDKRHRNALGQ